MIKQPFETDVESGQVGGEKFMRVELMSVPFDAISLDEATSAALTLLKSPGYSFITGTNSNLLRIARHNPAYRSAIAASDISLVDGIGVIWAARILGVPIRERVTIMDLVSSVCSRISDSKVFILGGKDGVAEKAGRNVPNLCGTESGYFDDSEATAKKISESHPDLLLVCLGSPKQELWMSQYGPLTGAHLAIGCGGWIDVCAGNLKRAPEQWRKNGLEWAWRLGLEPWRIGRVIGSAAILGLALKDKLLTEVKYVRKSEEKTSNC